VHIEQLTADQEASIRSALRELHAHLGTWRAVSEAIDIGARSIERVLCGRRRPTPGWALRLAPVLGVTVDAVLASSSTVRGGGRQP
jgi:plasmid maintenance system antidote protein VapI